MQFTVTINRSTIVGLALAATLLPLAAAAALGAALDAAFADGLQDWGPAVGSKAEGAYERGWSVFYAVEPVLRPYVAAALLERAQ